MRSAEPSPGKDLLEEEDHTGWIVTYADLVTLLLVFFVLLYSISSLNLAQFKQAVASIQTSLGTSKSVVGLLELVNMAEEVEEEIRIEDITGIRSREEVMLQDIRAFIAARGLGQNIDIEAQGGKIILRIRGQILFASGAAELNPDAYPVLAEILSLVRRYAEYYINIKGHTDDIPIATDRFPSNWELSAVRATSVLKYFIEQGINPRRLTATGYGASFPIVPNDTDINRAINRRVEFVLEKKTTFF